jgi:SAM-dependent methyltransferase
VFNAARCAHNSGMDRRICGFQDHFSAQAAAYARFRPSYPSALYEFLAGVAPARTLAWDCGTGNGQAAVGLAMHFRKVVASDASPAQVAQALQHARVTYYVASAEDPPAAAQGADLVTVAQALHWFDHARFYPALRRVLKPGGVFAAWGYGLMQITPAVDAVVQDFYANIVGPYWPPDRRHIEDAYQSLPFPPGEISVPAFRMRTDWKLEALLGYLDTWSATRRYLAEKGQHPLAHVQSALVHAWGAAETRLVTWPLFIRACRIAGF